MAQTEDNKKQVKRFMKMFHEYQAYKQPIMQQWRVIRSLYRGDFWDRFNKHLKDYTLKPDWNYFDYTIQAYLNSIYSGAFIGTLTPCRQEDTEAITALNAFISYNWNKWGMKNKFLHIGENGELYNVGAMRVDWDSTESSIVLKALSPDELYFDPNARSYKEGHAIFIERSIDIDTLRTHETFKKEVEAYLKTHTRIQDKTRQHLLADETQPTSDNKMVSLIECFERTEKGIEQSFILDEEVLLESKVLSIKHFPVVVFSPQRPDGNPYGMSKLKKILNNVITLNIIDSMEATQPYRLLNRVRFVNIDGRINMTSFAKYGNTPGASFEVKGDPANLIKYLDVPTIPDMTNLKNRLENCIFQVTGVDPYYKGRMTNSIQTTGATQAFQARVTMLTDNARITLLEEFCEDLTRLIIEYYTTYSRENTAYVPKYSATGTNEVVDSYSIEFAKIPTYNYMINASVLLPMNQANLFESAKALYEMQGQYGFKTPVITEEDLVRYSDFPQKDLILQRIQQAKQDDTAQNLVADLMNFASIFSKLLAQGVPETKAAEQAISILIEEKNAIMQNPELGRGLQ